MAAEKRTPNTHLTSRLVEESESFEFFQAIRILEAEAREAGRRGQRTPPSELGEDGIPAREPARFRSHASFEFPETDAISIKPAPEKKEAASPPEVIVAFFGLIGSSGALPLHYTRRVMERIHVRFRDTALHEFLDLFTHRLVSFFVRAWRKYRLPFSYERHRQIQKNAADVDAVTSAFLALAGLGTPALRNRQQLPDEIPVYYGGYFAHFPRSAVALEAMLADYLGVEVTVEQFRGRWLMIDDLQQSFMSNDRSGRNMALGDSLLSGRRVWDVRSMFGIHIGPLAYREFVEFMPTGNRLRIVKELVSLYVGVEFEFEVECRLQASEVPDFLIPLHEDEMIGDSQDKPVPPMLGWNTWLESGGREQEGEAVFR